MGGFLLDTLVHTFYGMRKSEEMKSWQLSINELRVCGFELHATLSG